MGNLPDKYLLSFVIPLGAAFIGWSFILGDDIVSDAAHLRPTLYFIFISLMLLVFSGFLAIHRQITIMQGISLAASFVTFFFAEAVKSEALYKLLFFIITALIYSLADVISRFRNWQKQAFIILSYLFVLVSLQAMIGTALQSLPWPIAWLIIFSLLPYLACFALVKASDHFPLTKL